jgi:ABC-type multidrug transport system ATPase subunit
VRGLSGGEKRRVSIASELLTRPAVIFLDEATTGLDSTNAAQVVEILSGLTLSGASVILTIHQPRSDVLSLLDRVLLMSGSGQVVYSGPIEQALDFFSDNGFVHEGVHNPADWMLDVVIKSQPGSIAILVEQFEASRVAAGKPPFCIDTLVLLPPLFQLPIPMLVLMPMPMLLLLLLMTITMMMMRVPM